MRHANASRGISLRQHSIILCTFAYKFISNLHYLNEIASSSPIITRLAMEDPISDPPTQPKRQKAQSLEDILLELGPITSISYEPFQGEPRQAARALLPTSFPQKPHPFDYFSLFFTRDLFQTITTNTNRYASIQRLHVAKERAREWTDLLIEELYVFIGAIIYIGIHKEP